MPSAAKAALQSSYFCGTAKAVLLTESDLIRGSLSGSLPDAVLPIRAKRGFPSGMTNKGSKLPLKAEEAGPERR